MSSKHVSTLIVGSGPTGLGAASRMSQHERTMHMKLDYLLIDANEEAGGLACTDVTEEGFLFDLGGHVIFSHFDYFDGLINAACGTDTWNTHQRVSYVWMRDRWIPYPFQNNITCLDVPDQIKCLTGLVAAKAKPMDGKPKNFNEWIDKVMGEGINEIFMRPYNFKVWAYPTSEMQCSWLGERVATADVDKAITNVLNKTVAGGWGPNAIFRFPKEGGTGGIWKNVSKNCVPQDKQQYNSKVVKINAAEKKVTLDNGDVITYDKLLSTIPLDMTLRMVAESETEDVAAKCRSCADTLAYSSSHIIGIGLRGVNPHDTKCWLYYPEDNCPFYRCTVFSHYAEKNCPDPTVMLPTLQFGDGRSASGSQPSSGPYWSLMLEVSESAAHKPVDMDKVVKECIQGCLNTKLIEAGTEIVSIYHRRLEHGYPTPHVDRDGVLAEALPLLKDRDIWSRGRFGSWKYEVANQDHSTMLGVEAVDNMLFGSREFTLNYCSLVNERGRKYTDMKFSI
ncbi:hypothetical protein TrST_g1136 [Triparma strigata]|uniref:Amine oxidase domain-containing protein n=1 Tax=Triparma strigata TaxID=1606541 RepID=A0A9W7E7Z9_9STRA|nr:hypothetical protein TrST_g1136 [Triparma strigata]